ncbi:hypothetical protein MKP07_18145 [Niabella hibiscisoli]|nr:hypothetical protein [Niabella hibiscisoli]
MRGADGYFYVTMTDLHIFAKEIGYRDTEWERPAAQYDWGNNKGLVLMKSKDLLHWTHTRVNMDRQFPELNIGCAWAPELIYDQQLRKMMIYFTMRSGKGKTKLYYSYLNKDFTRPETKPKILFEYPDTTRQILDADITRLPDGRYCMMYVAQENPSGIKMAFSQYINKGYQYQPDQVDFESRSCEAPHVYQLIGKNEWILMYDIFGIKPHNFGFARTTDFKTFTHLGRFNEGIMKTDNFTSPKHGAVVQLTDTEMERLGQYYKGR